MNLTLSEVHHHAVFGIRPQQPTAGMTYGSVYNKLWVIYKDRCRRLSPTATDVTVHIKYLCFDTHITDVLSHSFEFIQDPFTMH